MQAIENNVAFLCDHVGIKDVIVKGQELKTKSG
jgi:hypothetical protein